MIADKPADAEDSKDKTPPPPPGDGASNRRARIVTTDADDADREGYVAGANANLIETNSDSDGDGDGDLSDLAGVLENTRLEGGWLTEARRPAIETLRPHLALIAALTLHAGLAAAALTTMTSARLGADGVDLSSISVEIVSVDRLDGRSGDAAKVKASPSQRPETDQPGANQDAIASRARADSAQRRAAPAKPVPEAASQPAPVKPDIALTVKPQDQPDADMTVAPRRSKTPSRVVTAKPEATSRPRQDRTQNENKRKQQPREPETANKATKPDSVTSAASTPSKSSLAQKQGGRVRGREDERANAARLAAAKRAVGRKAKAYGQKLLKSLSQLEQFLQTTNAQRGSRRAGQVVLMLTIGVGGRARNVSVARSSGQPGLDRLALTDVTAFRFPQPPSELSPARRTFRLPITYR